MISWLRTKKDHLSTPYTLIIFFTSSLQLMLYVAKEKGTSPIFLQTTATMEMNIFSTLPNMIIKEPSSMKRNSRPSSHIQMLPLEPFALFLYIFSLPLNLRANLLFSLLSFPPSWIPTFSFGFPNHPDKLPSASHL